MSTSSNQSIGMMDPAYFQGRKLILEWINDVCDLNLSKVEQTSNGAIACQLLDSIFPGKVPMSRVDWGAKVDYEFINNYKILQNAFLKLKIDKPIYMEKLIRGRYQDNLEFMQWFKGFYDNSINVENYLDLEYDAQSQRNKGKSGPQYHAKFGRGSTKKAPVSRSTSSSRIPTTRKASATATKSSSGAGVDEFKSKIRKLEKQMADLSTENDQLNADIEHCNETIKEVEKERNFYYNKLQRVESFLINLPEDQVNNISEQVKNILYAEAEADDHLLKDEETQDEEVCQDKYNPNAAAQYPEEEEAH